jgi:hypothetical protein
MSGILEAAFQRNLPRSCLNCRNRLLALIPAAIAGTSIGLSQFAAMNSSTVRTADAVAGSGSRNKKCA